MKVKVIAFTNQKGGVGKTTVSTNTAFYLSTIGKKVLLIDADMQGNATASFLAEQPELELANIFYDDCTITDGIKNIRENLDIIPTKKGSKKLIDFSKNEISSYLDAFKDLVALIRSDFNYDFIIYDCNPSIGIFEKSIIASADECIVPLQPEAFAIDGLGIFNKELINIRKRQKSNVQHNKIIFNMVDERLNIHKRYMKALNDAAEFDFFVIPATSDFKTAQDRYLSVFEFESKSKPKERAEREIKRLAEVLL